MSEYGYVHISFVDGTEEKIFANEARVNEGVLWVKETNRYGVVNNRKNFPLTNIRSWTWVDR